MSDYSPGDDISHSEILDRMQKLQDNRDSYSKASAQDDIAQIFGVEIEGNDTQWKHFENAELVNSYPLQETHYFNEDGEEKYLVYIHILYNNEKNEPYYIIDEPILNTEEKRRFEELKEKIKTKLRTINREELGVKLDEPTKHDAELEVLKQNVESELDIQYGAIRSINNSIRKTGDLINILGNVLNVEPFVTFQSESYTFEEFPEKTRRKLLYYLERDILRYKELTPLMMDKKLEEISVNGPNKPVYVVHEQYQNDCKVNRAYTQVELNSRVKDFASLSNGEVNKSSPGESGALPDGSRIEMQWSNEVTKKAGAFTIRKFQDVPFTPVDLVEYKTFSVEQMVYLWLAIQNGASIIFAGGTASGKTTALNAATLFLQPTKKIVSIEDTPELRIDEENTLNFLTREDTGTNNITIADLLESSLRHRPVTIIVGETRGEEAQEMVEAANTGHSVFTTFHADSVKEAISRLTGERIGIPKEDLQAFNVVVNLQTRGKRRIAHQINEITGYDSDDGEINYDSVSEFDGQLNEFTMNNYTTSEVIKQKLIEKGISKEKINKEVTQRKIIIKYLNELLPTREELSEKEQNRDEMLEQKYAFERDIIKSYTAHSKQDKLNPVIKAISTNSLLEYSDVDLDLFDISESIDMNTIPETQQLSEITTIDKTENVEELPENSE